MSEMHAETALWIDGLRKRADKCEGDLGACPPGHRHTVAARDRLQELRGRLDGAAARGAEGHADRSELETMMDDIDAALARARARM